MNAPKDAKEVQVCHITKRTYSTDPLTCQLAGVSEADLCPVLRGEARMFIVPLSVQEQTLNVIARTIRETAGSPFTSEGLAGCILDDLRRAGLEVRRG